MGNHRPPGQLCQQAQGVPTEVLQEAMRRKGGLTMTSGKHLPIETPGNGAVTWYLIRFLRITFSYGCMARGLVFNGHGMHE